MKTLAALYRGESPVDFPSLWRPAATASLNVGRLVVERMAERFE